MTGEGELDKNAVTGLIPPGALVVAGAALGNVFVPGVGAVVGAAVGGAGEVFRKAFTEKHCGTCN